MLVVAGMLVASSLAPLLVLVGLLLEVVAVVLALRAFSRGRAQRQPAPGAIAALVTGSAAVLVLVVILGFVAIFYQEYLDYQVCLERALTESAEAECRTTLEDAVFSRLGGAE